METGQIQIQIPSIVLKEELMNLNQDAEEREVLARKIREACERYGCFLIDCGGTISEEEQQRFFSTSEEFFGLSDEVKKHYGRKPKPWHGGYIGINPYSRQESFGVYGLGDDEVRSLAHHMWPQGNPSFCEVVQSMKMKLMDVALSVMRLTFEDLGISEYYYDKQAENVTCILRSLKYKLLPTNNEEVQEDQDDIGNSTNKKPTQGLMPHVDHSILSVLYDNGVSGLEVLSEDGEWSPVAIPAGSLVVIVGDAFEVLSNGKFRAVRHRVTMHAGKKEKYTCALFMLPKDGAKMEVPPEMVAEGESPLFRPFVFSDYLEKHVLDPNVEALKVFAGVNSVV